MTRLFCNVRLPDNLNEFPAANPHDQKKSNQHCVNADIKPLWQVGTSILIGNRLFAEGAGQNSMHKNEAGQAKCNQVLFHIARLLEDRASARLRLSSS